MQCPALHPPRAPVHSAPCRLQRRCTVVAEAGPDHGSGLPRRVSAGPTNTDRSLGGRLRPMAGPEPGEASTMLGRFRIRAGPPGIPPRSGTAVAWVAQSVEQRTRNAQVRSSNLLSGSSSVYRKGDLRSRRSITPDSCWSVISADLVTIDVSEVHDRATPRPCLKAVSSARDVEPTCSWHARAQCRTS